MASERKMVFMKSLLALRWGHISLILVHFPSSRAAPRETQPSFRPITFLLVNTANPLDQLNTVVKSL